MKSKIVGGILLSLLLVDLLLMSPGTAGGQQKTEIVKMSAPATGPQNAASADAVSCALDTGCVIKAVSGNLADGALVTLGAKADARANNTDATAITAMQVLKEISYLLQNGVLTLPIGVASCYLKGGTGSLADTTNHANCKNANAALYGIRAINTGAAKAYLRLYNLATDPTCSSATGFLESIPIPADVAGSGGAGFIDSHPQMLYSFSAGLAYCLTGGGGNTDNTAPPAGVYVTLQYQ
jgi:hypothetical protein